MTTIILAVGVLIVSGGLYLLYVQLIKKKNKVFEAFSSIDVQLKKRFDLIPNILTIAQQFMEHERGLMEDITKLRTQVLEMSDSTQNAKKKFELSEEIQGKMSQLMVSVENYPQLKSNETMVQAMQTYSEVEEHIAAARRFYNSAIFELKNAIETFPSSVIAENMGIKLELPFFEASENEKQPINAKDFFKK